MQLVCYLLCLNLKPIFLLFFFVKIWSTEWNYLEIEQGFKALLLGYFMAILGSLLPSCLLIPCPIESWMTMLGKVEIKNSICWMHFLVKVTCPLLRMRKISGFSHELDVFFFFLSYVSFCLFVFMLLLFLLQFGLGIANLQFLLYKSQTRRDNNSGQM